MFNENMDLAAVEAVRRQLNVHQVSFEARYIGLPTPDGRLKAEKFQTG